MVIVKINKWNDTDRMVQTSTIWELSKDESFTDILDKVEKTTDIYVYNIRNDKGGNIALDASTKYYLRATRKFNNSTEELVADIFTINSNSTITDFEVSLISNYDDVVVYEPTITLDYSKIDINKVIVNTSDFKSNRGTHIATNWYITDIEDNILFNSMNDTINLTSIELDTKSDCWNNYGVIKIYASHISNLRTTSKAGYITIQPNESINFSLELPDYIEYNTEYTLNVNAKSNLYSNGIYKVVISNNQTNYELTNITNSITIPGWLVTGDHIRLDVYYTTTLGECNTSSYTIPVVSVGRDILSSNYKYNNILDTNITINGTKSTLDIEEYYQGEYLHNGYIPIVKDGIISLYNLIDNNLVYIDGGDSILIDSSKNIIKYSKITNIRRMSNSLLVIVGTKDSKNVISIFKYISTSGKYEFVIDYPEDKGKKLDTNFGKGNSIAIMNSNEIYYKPSNDNGVYKLNLQTGDNTYVTNIVGLTKDDTFIDENGTTINNLSIEPSFIAADNSLLVVGGHNGSTYRFDGVTELYSKPLYSYTFPHNQLGVSPLINGDSLIYKKTNYIISASEANELLANNVPTISFKTLEEEYAAYKVLGNNIVNETKFNIDVSSINTTYDSEITINFDTNIDNRDSYYVKYDETLFKVIEKTTTYIKFKIPFKNSKYTTTRYIKFVACKNQIFNQTTYNSTKNYDSTVIEKEVLIKVIPDNVTTTSTTTLSTSSGDGYFYFYGNKYYRYSTLEIDAYLGDLSLPFKLYGLDCNDYNVSIDDDITIVSAPNITKYGYDLYIVDFNKITTSGEFTFTINDVVGEFIKVKVNVLPERYKKTKPTITLRDTLIKNQEPIGFIDKRVVPFTMTNNDNTTFINSNDNIVTIYKDTDYLGDDGDLKSDRYGMIVRGDGVGIVYVKDNTIPDNIYISSYFIICSIDGTAIVKNGYKLSGNNKIVTLDKDYYVIKSDTSLNNKCIFKLDSDDLVTMSYNQATITMPSNKSTTNIITYVKTNINSNEVLEEFISNQIEVTNNEDTKYAYLKNTTRRYYNGKDEIVFLPNANDKDDVWYDLELSHSWDVVIDKGLAIQKVNDKLYRIRVDNKSMPYAIYESKVIINPNSADVITKTIKVVPILYVIEDGISGQIPIEQYNGLMSETSNSLYDIVTIYNEGYFTTDLNPTIVNNESKYNIISYHNNNKLTFSINPYIKYSSIIDPINLWLDYNYSIPDKLDLEMVKVTSDNTQMLNIKIVDVLPSLFLKVDELTSTSILSGSSVILGIKTNGEYIVTSDDESIISVNDNMLTAVSNGYTCVTISAVKDGYKTISVKLYLTVVDLNTSSSSRYAVVTYNINNYTMFTNSELPVTFTTDADSLNITSSNTSIVKWDNIKNSFIAGSLDGEVTITIKTKSSLLLETTKTFNLSVIERNTIEPGMLVYDHITSEFKEGPSYNNIVPTSSILTKQGCVLLVDSNGNTMLYK
jgi:hypothetical protein